MEDLPEYKDWDRIFRLLRREQLNERRKEENVWVVGNKEHNRIGTETNWTTINSWTIYKTK